jgi:predicted AAA+ superfamily ATPase
MSITLRSGIKVDDCTVVTWDDEGESDGIKIVPAWKWCLEK